MLTQFVPVAALFIFNKQIFINQFISVPKKLIHEFSLITIDNDGLIADFQTKTNQIMRKNLLSSKRKAINTYFAFILQVL